MTARLVGQLYSHARFTASISKSATRRSLRVTEVNSGTTSGAYERSQIFSHEISFSNGPLGPPTLIGNVRTTTTTFSINLGASPTSDANPDAVVSREVTKGYLSPCRRDNAKPWLPSTITSVPVSSCSCKRGAIV